VKFLAITLIEDYATLDHPSGGRLELIIPDPPWPAGVPAGSALTGSAA
jgi:hypothetical protein